MRSKFLIIGQKKFVILQSSFCLTLVRLSPHSRLTSGITVSQNVSQSISDLLFRFSVQNFRIPMQTFFLSLFSHTLNNYSGISVQSDNKFTVTLPYDSPD